MFIVYQSHIVPWLPGILFGTLSIVVGLLTLLLPETLNRPLPQTIEEIDMWNKAGLGKVPPQDDQVEFKADTLEMGNDVKTWLVPTLTVTPPTAAPDHGNVHST